MAAPSSPPSPLDRFTRAQLERALRQDTAVFSADTVFPEDLLTIDTIAPRGTLGVALMRLELEDASEESESSSLSPPDRVVVVRCERRDGALRVPLTERAVTLSEFLRMQLNEGSSDAAGSDSDLLVPCTLVAGEIFEQVANFLLFTSSLPPVKVIGGEIKKLSLTRTQASIKVEGTTSISPSRLATMVSAHVPNFRLLLDGKPFGDPSPQSVSLICLTPTGGTMEARWRTIREPSVLVARSASGSRLEDGSRRVVFPAAAWRSEAAEAAISERFTLTCESTRKLSFSVTCVAPLTFELCDDDDSSSQIPSGATLSLYRAPAVATRSSLTEQARERLQAAERASVEVESVGLVPMPLPPGVPGKPYDLFENIPSWYSTFFETFSELGTSDDIPSDLVLTNLIKAGSALCIDSLEQVSCAVLASKLRKTVSGGRVESMSASEIKALFDPEAADI